MRVLFLMPRLDCTFKEGYVPAERGPIVPIREHWKTFALKVAEEHTRRGDQMTVLELPLWQFLQHNIQQTCDTYQYDRVYIPHKEFRNFPITGRCKPYYYMQTQFPWIFSVDSQGWGSGASAYPFLSEPTDDSSAFDTLRAVCQTGQSKFGQVPRGTNLDKLPSSFLFFPCQLPHDETIRFHSSWSVERALDETCDLALRMGQYLVVKGHPVNPGSMQPLREIVHSKRDARLIWLDEINIHDVLTLADVTITVNSGVGFESLLAQTSVLNFGEAEYDTATTKVTATMLQSSELTFQFNKQIVNGFFKRWTAWTYNTHESFSHLPT
jgi:hypothetical protein